ncbi:MAG: LytTR family DNA-binding domain-containing protein [Lachnospiraceae bacterium]|nr:LytTR family DNA-binding domain-containing protein [Lachnospiraceae bacterium]
MPYRIFICDDEPQMLQCLSASVKERLSDSEISVFSDGGRLKAALEGVVPCDILLLDIDMPGLSGLDIAAGLSGMERRPLLVFVTSHDELVYDSLQFHPFGFVRKSCMDAELEKLLADCVKELSGRERHFCFPAAGARIKLPLADILYFEAEGNYLKLFAREERCPDRAACRRTAETPYGSGVPAYSPKGLLCAPGEASYRFRETLSAVEAALSGSGFVRVHKGYLVNQAAVRSLGADGVLLTNGTSIPIGRSYAEAAKRTLMRYMIG